MPAYKSQTVLEVARGVKAFFKLEAGLTRGEIPDLEQEVARTRDELARTREKLVRQDRQLEQLRKRLYQQNRQGIKRPSAATRPASVTNSRDDLRSQVSTLLEQIPVDFGGGCSVDKAYVMASLIQRYDLRTTVDIGVYRGRSLFPQALAHQLNGGVVYGIDPWSSSEAQENDNPEIKEAIDNFTRTTDFQAIYEEVDSLVDSLGYRDHCILLRTTSSEAAGFFGRENISFKMVHIDGNHDTEKVMEDLALYEPRLEEGGYIVLDDVSWDSVRPAYESLSTRLALLFERVSGHDDYAVFLKSNSMPTINERRKHLADIVGG